MTPRSCIFSLLCLLPTVSTSQSLEWSRILQHARVLSHDSLAGRGTTHPGGKAAARYLVETLQSAGLQPGGPDGSWTQGFPVHASRPLSATSCDIAVGDDQLSLRLWDDIILLSHGNQTFVSQAVPMIFVGYGIDAPEFSYSDYESVDVQGAVAVMFTGEPPSEHDSYFAGSRSTPHASLLAKQKEALARGARGTIIIPTQRTPVFGDWEAWVSEFSFEEVRLPYGPPDQLHMILRRERAARMLEMEGTTIDSLVRADSAGTLHSFSLDAHMTFDGHFVESDEWVVNVAALLKGSDPMLSSTTVIVGAHYDHLGVGPSLQGDSIYNGLQDNAIGVATLLELARVMALESLQPKRSVLFLLFTGEEKGLLGSRYYVDHPLRPLSSTIAMVNIDGISTIDRLRTFIPVGTDRSSLDTTVRRVLSIHGLTVDSIPSFFSHQDPLVSSDHWSFWTAGIPSMLLSEGLSYERAGEDGVRRFLRYAGDLYHSPFDDMSIHIDRDAVIQHADVLHDLIMELANCAEPPRWRRAGEMRNARTRPGSAENR